MRNWQDVDGCLLEISTGGETIKVPTLKCLEVVFGNILSMILTLATLALFVMLVVGGVKFLMSGGDPKATTSAKQTMTYAIAGIALMSIAFLVFRMIEVFTGVNVTTFRISEF